MVTLKVRHFARHSDNLSLDMGISLRIWFVKCFFLGGGGEVLAGIGSGCFCVRGDRDSSVCRWSLSRGRGGVRDCFFICMGFLAQEEAEVGSDNTIYYVNFALPDPHVPNRTGMAYALSRWSRGSYIYIILPQ